MLTSNLLGYQSNSERVIGRDAIEARNRSHYVSIQAQGTQAGQNRFSVARAPIAGRPKSTIGGAVGTVSFQVGKSVKFLSPARSKGRWGAQRSGRKSVR